MSREQAMVIEDKARFLGFTTYHVGMNDGSGGVVVVLVKGNTTVQFETVRQALVWLTEYRKAE